MADSPGAAAQEMVRDGYAYVPFDSYLVEHAQQAYHILLRSVSAHGTPWSITRSNETEPELGFISKSGVGADDKTFFHFAFDLVTHLKKCDIPITKQQEVCLESIDRLYHALKMLARQVAAIFLEKSFEVDVLTLITESFKSGIVSGTSTLRFLEYPDVVTQLGAREHYDKSFLTIHLGDSGGDLLGYIESEWVNVSPPPGYALLFFGVKAMAASRGKILPLRHKSTTIPGKARQAVVMFVHADVGLTVRSAQETYDALIVENQL